MRKWAEKAVEIIIDLYDPDKIILFGSYAKNAHTLQSDIDLLIIKDTDIPKIYRGIEVLSALTRYPIKFDLLFYTNKELAEGLMQEYSFIRSIIRSGNILYQKA